MVKQPKPTKHSHVVFNQLCKLIPVGMVRNLASEYGVDKKCRTFSAWSHVVSLLYAQLTHSIGLNDVCDALRHHSSKLFAIRGATPPSRNGLSHANKTSEADMMEALFWKMLTHLQSQFPHFGPSGSYGKLPYVDTVSDVELLRRFKVLYPKPTKYQVASFAEIERLLRTGGDEASEVRRKLLVRMGDLSEFMKTVKNPSQFGIIVIISATARCGPTVSSRC
ncbi:MAG: hypothetical protein ACI9JZ_002120 [Lentimonas sp.]